MQLDDGIQFGEVEEASPQANLRPDRNKHFAVAEYEAPADRDLPIFVDLDVLQDMEDHALSDTTVELGGVLLGGCYEDEAGRPFVVVTDSLRAQHYESTKGSFKFTHDTWSAITREREEFPPELQMVGWYHTHPDWGVFLSGMDMFICDNFFNKRLDVAYVIDPCRGDRGMFQWTGDERQRVRRTGGFFVTASRFRAAELEHYVGELSGKMPATSTQRGTSGGYGAPVVHLHQPAPARERDWQGPAMIGMLTLQFCLLALIAWKVIDPAGAALGGSASADEQLAELKQALEIRAEADAALEKLKWRTQMLDEVAAELKGTSPGFVERLTEKYDETQRLNDDIEARTAEKRVLEASLSEVQRKRSSAASLASLEQERLNREIGLLEARLDKLGKENESLAERLAVHEPPKAKDGNDAPTQRWSVWWYVGGGLLAAVILGAGVWWGSKMLMEQEDQPVKEHEPSSDDVVPEPPRPE